MMTIPTNTIQGPHQGQPVLAAGEPLDRVTAAMVMVHGRGARAEDFLTRLEAAEEVAGGAGE